jgi:hypothetical protein
MNTIKNFIIIALGLLTFACAPSRFVEPLAKNELSIGANFGGPVIDFNGPVPMPLTAIEIGYGIDSNLTAFGALHTTAMLFGNFQFDGGVSYKFLNQKKYIPNLSVAPSFNIVSNFEYKSTKFWPILDINAFWNYGERRNFFYVGFNNYFELSSTMANEQAQAQHWVFNPQFGHVIKGKKAPWQLSAEFKFLAPYIDNSYAFIPYKSLTGTRGATGFYLSYKWIFKTKNK